METEYIDNQIIKSRIIQTDFRSLWERWTTHEGLKTFFGSQNLIELKPGGAFEIYFLMENPEGLRGSETCKVLSFLPHRFFSFSWNVPPHFEALRKADYKTWVVVEFQFITNSETQVTLSHLGWTEAPQWQEVFDYFDEAWDYVLDNLKNSYK